MPDQLTMRERISKLEEVINGNGKEGLKTEIALIKKEQETMTEGIDSLAKSYSALVKVHEEQDTISKFKEENRAKRARAWHQIGLVISIVGGALGALYLVLDHIK